MVKYEIVAFYYRVKAVEGCYSCWRDNPDMVNTIESYDGSSCESIEKAISRFDRYYRCGTIVQNCINFQELEKMLNEFEVEFDNDDFKMEEIDDKAGEELKIKWFEVRTYSLLVTEYDDESQDVVTSFCFKDSDDSYIEEQLEREEVIVGIKADAENAIAQINEYCNQNKERIRDRIIDLVAWAITPNRTHFVLSEEQLSEDGFLDMSQSFYDFLANEYTGINSINDDGKGTIGNSISSDLDKLGIELFREALKKYCADDYILQDVVEYIGFNHLDEEFCDIYHETVAWKFGYGWEYVFEFSEMPNMPICEVLKLIEGRKTR